MHRPSYSTFDSYDHVDSDSGEINFPYAIATNQCPICVGNFVDLVHLKSDAITYGLHLCAQCGWWHFHEDHRLFVSESGDLGEQRKLHFARWWEMHHAALERIDLSDESMPIETLRAHLTRYWDQRTALTAQQAEDLVASVLREQHGGDVIRLSANANAADGGIDLVLISDGGNIRRAVQVKRRLKRDMEGVQEVRNFIGAMVLSGERRGTFVTTASRFSRVARKLPASPNLSRAKLNLELLDGEQLLELLEHSALKRDLSLPPHMSLDQNWIAMGNGDDFFEVGARELLLGDLRRVAPLARQSGLLLALPKEFARPVSDFRRDFSPVPPSEAEKMRGGAGGDH